MIDKEEIVAIKEQYPDLTCQGFRYYAKIGKQKSEDFLTDKSLANIRHSAYQTLLG